MRTYSDDQLTRAVAESRSWRGVLRHLGLKATSGSAMRSVRRHAERLDLDRSHFTGQRRWTDQQLDEAVATSGSWTQVHDRLGLSGGSSSSIVRNHALRLGLDTQHLAPPLPFRDGPVMPGPQSQRLRRAGALLAAAWFELVGSEVAWPLEPCRYDLLVVRGGETRRVQVKTTINRSGRTWTASLTCTSARDRVYAPGEIDEFFIIDGDLHMYLIPFEVVAGRSAVQVAHYANFQVRPFALDSSMTVSGHQ